MYNNSAAKKEQSNGVVQILSKHFGSYFDLEIIQSVAQSCDYNLTNTTQALMGMIHTNTADSRPSVQQTSSYANIATKSSNGAVSNSRLLQKSNLKPVQTKVSSGQCKSKKQQVFEKAILNVKKGWKVMILMRGLPGSGKSYLARQIVERGITCSDYSKFILSADDFFINPQSGRYEYNRAFLQKAHEWNQQRAYKNMSDGISPVIIDNTNLETWEMKPYVMMAVNFNYVIEIVEPFTYWAFNEKELANRNSHNVPKIKIREMLERYEKNVTVPKLLSLYGRISPGTYKPQEYRTYPPLDMNVSTIIDNAENRISIEDADSQENQDMMDFDSEVFVKSTENSLNKEGAGIESNSVDYILMYTAQGNNNSNNILKPDVCSLPQKHSLTAYTEPEYKKAKTYSLSNLNHDLVTTSEEICNLSNDVSEAAVISPLSALEIKKARDLYPKLDLSSWGLHDDALTSWETWDIVKPVDSLNTIDSRDMLSCITSSNSLVMVDSETNTCSADFGVLNKNTNTSDDIKVLNTTSRNINQGLLKPMVYYSNKLLVDKSSMTNEDILIAALSRKHNAEEENLLTVQDLLFPNVPIDYIKDVYEKCGKDINWTVDLLLDDKREFLSLQQYNDGNNNKNCKLGTKNDTEIIPGPLQTSMENLSICLEMTDKKETNTNNKSLLEKREELKKHLENSIKLNKDYYSDHILKLKEQRSGNSHNINNELEPSTSKMLSTSINDSSNVAKGDSETGSDTFISDSEEEEEEEIIELNLGNNVIEQLEAKFSSSQSVPQGYLPIVYAPVSLARQLYALYMQSVFVQIENQNRVYEVIAKEDEEFAKKLQLQECEKVMYNNGRKTPDLKEIMDEQTAVNLYLKDSEQWKTLTMDNLALRLTHQKLYNAFPTVNKDLLLEILYAHNNSYQQTLEVLMDSTDSENIHDPDGNLMEPPFTESVINEMKKDEEVSKQTELAADISKTATEYREEARQYHNKHEEFMRKAQEAYQRKQFPVAQFYSNLAKNQTQFYDQANNLAASVFLRENQQKMEHFKTIDLHYLYVKEAITALDLFLDANIQLLVEMNKSNTSLFIITGRGNRSEQGRARIKPAVIKRLSRRHIRYVQVNPGLLKIKVHFHSARTNALN